MMSPQSDSIADLAKALAEAQGVMEAPQRTKDAKVQGETKSGSKYEYGYKYAPMEEVTRVIKDPLAAHGLSWRQGMLAEGDKIFVRTVIMHVSGQWYASDYPVHVSKPGAQGFAGGASYARRYGLTFALGIAAEDDDDANAADGNTAEIISRPAKAVATRGATRTAAPEKPAPAPTAAAGNSRANGRPMWIDEFLNRKSYEIDPQKAGGWSAWEKFYMDICRWANCIDQVNKLKSDNGDHFAPFEKAVRKDVFEHFWSKVKEEENRLWPAPDASAVLDEMSAA